MDYSQEDLEKIREMCSRIRRKLKELGDIDLEFAEDIAEQLQRTMQLEGATLEHVIEKFEANIDAGLKHMDIDDELAESAYADDLRRLGFVEAASQADIAADCHDDERLRWHDTEDFAALWESDKPFFEYRDVGDFQTIAYDERRMPWVARERIEEDRLTGMGFLRYDEDEREVVAGPRLN